MQARRDLLFDRFLAFWREQEEAGTWDRLERAVRARLREIKERRRAEERIENARRELEEAERKSVPRPSARARRPPSWHAARQSEDRRIWTAGGGGRVHVRAVARSAIAATRAADRKSDPSVCRWLGRMFGHMPSMRFTMRRGPR